MRDKYFKTANGAEVLSITVYRRAPVPARLPPNQYAQNGPVPAGVVCPSIPINTVRP